MTEGDGRDPLERVEALLGALSTVLLQIDERLQALDAPAAAAPAVPSLATVTLTSLGDYWAFAYGRDEVVVKDSRGVQHLSRLMARPNQQVHVLELFRGAHGPPRARHDEHGPVTVEGPAGPVLDRTARAAYGRRLAELRTDENGCTADLRLEREVLEAELRRATALHGRDRTFSDPVERARVAVTKAVRSSIAAVSTRDRQLGDHLERAVRTGTWCSYVVEPLSRDVGRRTARSG